MGLFDTLKEAFSPDRPQAVHYQCGNCSRRFVYRADLAEPTCPYCDSPELERLDEPAQL